MRGCLSGAGGRGEGLHRIPAVEILREDLRTAARPDRYPSGSAGLEIRGFQVESGGGVLNRDQGPGDGRPGAAEGAVFGQGDIRQCPDGGPGDSGVLPDRAGG